MNSDSVIIFISLMLFHLTLKCRPDLCYQKTENPFSLFATKTAYTQVSAKQNYTPPNCKAMQLWLLSRHGTRNPASVIIDEISNLTEYKNKITENSSLCKEDIEAIKTWNSDMTKEDGNMLNSQGIEDLSSLGRRLRSLYGDSIFNTSYSHEHFKVLSSPKTRSKESAFHFLRSVFNTNITDIPVFDDSDIILNITKFKKLNDDDDLKGIGLIKEVNSFYLSSSVKQLVIRVSEAMGLDDTLMINTIITMYDSCRYEKARKIDSRPAWCAVFSQEDLEILEYGEDLSYYYTNGYGDPYNERIGCPIVKDLVESFRSKSRTRNGPNGVFYFGHSSNVFSAIVRLGFARDTSSLLSKNFDEMRNRNWRTSSLTPFASNVMAVLYDCQGVDKVTFFINEIPMVVEPHGCTLCPWEMIENTLDPIVSDPSCTFDEISSDTSASNVPKTKYFIILVTCSFSILKSLSWSK